MLYIYISVQTKTCKNKIVIRFFKSFAIYNITVSVESLCRRVCVISGKFPSGLSRRVCVCMCTGTKKLLHAKCICYVAEKESSHSINTVSKSSGFTTLDLQVVSTLSEQSSNHWAICKIRVNGSIAGSQNFWFLSLSWLTTISARLR